MLKLATIGAVTSRPWLYSHQYDGANPGRIMEFDPSGKINGYNGEQEAHWVIEDAILWFINIHGQRSVRFDVSYRSLGKLVLEGQFVQPGLEGFLVRLDEGKSIERLTPVEIHKLSASRHTPFQETWVDYPPVKFGEPSLDGDRYFAPAFHCFTLNDVNVVSKFGGVRKNGYLISESAFQHPFSLCQKLADDNHGKFLHYSAGSPLEVDQALYACGGMYSNFYHWLMFLMTRIRPEFLGECDTIVISDPSSEFQRTGLRILSRLLGLKVIYLKDEVSLGVKELRFPIQLGTTGVDPHPCVADTFAMLKKALVDGSKGSGDRIYISRADTAQRPLTNEAEIEALLTKKNFSIVTLTGKTLQEQISIFDQASIVVAPHGAGLTNVGFCRPGARVLELQNPSYTNWCMKKLAVLSGLTYGHLMGTPAGTSNGYAIDVARIGCEVDAMLS